MHLEIDELLVGVAVVVHTVAVLYPRLDVGYGACRRSAVILERPAECELIDGGAVTPESSGVVGTIGVAVGAGNKLCGSRSPVYIRIGIAFEFGPGIGPG